MKEFIINVGVPKRIKDHFPEAEVDSEIQCDLLYKEDIAVILLHYPMVIGKIKDKTLFLHVEELQLVYSKVIIVIEGGWIDDMLQTTNMVPQAVYGAIASLTGRGCTVIPMDRKYTGDFLRRVFVKFDKHYQEVKDKQKALQRICWGCGKQIPPVCDECAQKALEELKKGKQCTCKQTGKLQMTINPECPEHGNLIKEEGEGEQ